jgi:hypothetical protein
LAFLDETPWLIALERNRSASSRLAGALLQLMVVFRARIFGGEGRQLLLDPIAAGDLERKLFSRLASNLFARSTTALSANLKTPATISRSRSTFEDAAEIAPSTLARRHSRSARNIRT